MTERSLRTYEGAVTIVTGAASGIGRGLSLELAERGATVVLADRRGDRADELAEEIQRAGGKASAATLDVRDFDAVKALVDVTAVEHRRLDYLFNNAGIAVVGETYRYRPEHWDDVIDVDLRGVTNGVQAAYSLMVSQGFGHIVNTSSIAGLTPTPGGVAYSAAKHAVLGLSTSLRIEAAQYGVRVSALCPGVVRTRILDRGGEFGAVVEEAHNDLQEKLLARLHPIEPDDFARRALDQLAADRAIIVIPGWWRVFWWLHRLSPAIGDLLARRLYEFWRKPS